VSPLRGEKPQNWPLSKLNTGRFALRAMLPVITIANKSQGNDKTTANIRNSLVIQCYVALLTSN